MSIKIIAGQYKSRLLEVPAVSRPTLARARQVVFDILYSLIPGGVGDKIVLDCFAGSGAMALEALSRGASYAYLMDKDHTAIGVMHDNIKKLGITNASIMRVDLQKRIYKNKERAVDIVFLDPPYDCVFSDYGNEEYKDGFNEANHRKLAEDFANLPCMALMIIGRTRLTEELYKGYIIDEYKKNYAVNIRNRFKSASTHIVIANYRKNWDTAGINTLKYWEAETAQPRLFEADQPYGKD